MLPETDTEDKGLVYLTLRTSDSQYLTEIEDFC